MGDQDDGFSIISEVADDRQQGFNLLRRQHCCRLIKDQNFSFPVQHFQDLDTLLCRYTCIFDHIDRIDFQTVLLRKRLDLLICFF